MNRTIEFRGLFSADCIEAGYFGLLAISGLAVELLSLGRQFSASDDPNGEDWGMTTAFKDFLRQQAEKHQAEVGDKKATLEEWRTAIERLFAQLRTWLKESDPESVIEIKEGQHDVTEPGLGRYQVPRLDLHAFGKWVGIIPKARRTVGSAKPPQKTAPERAVGRVDMTDELRRYILYRFQDGGQDVWLIDDPTSEAKPLDQEAFERALMSYLR